MKVKETAKAVWNDHKEVICFATGIVVATTVCVIIYKTKGKVLEKSAFIMNKNPEFPLEMSVKDIKEALSKVEGAKFYDSLVVVRNGISSLFIREPV